MPLCPALFLVFLHALTHVIFIATIQNICHLFITFYILKYQRTETGQITQVVTIFKCQNTYSDPEPSVNCYTNS
jgi:hypothetical protein